MHPLPNTWQFDGNIEKPTFNPSFKHEGLQTVKDSNGKWLGEWVRDSAGNTIKEICHYHLHGGMLMFCPDCTHELSGKTVPLPELPEFYRDRK